MKTNAARILDGLQFAYELREYEVDETDLSAKNVAEKVGMPDEQIFKTLVLRGDKTGVIMACIPGAAELDLKFLAAASGNKKVEMVSLKEVQPLTGYIRGGVSPLGPKKRYPVFLDKSAAKWQVIAVSAGIRGCQIILSPEHLVQAVNAQVCSITRGSNN
ncbi:Cys-tRNA(Pro)/Cys-tRNA(Cys) deacylase YbaK [Sporomusa ovata DSM 2662]|uniref:Cys-tRNA(Pro)/Cys-tRNA(Cys) deacylase n=1 Tax=Sporomusa ovata TaxID=2378 RepID=A0A0U1KRL8_9FIRM|nr:Cys-tRNA(Pro) deacylase [Sporomusa ovata]EQB24880.1 YbaK/EbsC family protein [Sporomusa ovata DSM 2662]CQR70077.1 Cys-tRNA(Pro) deacylase YbaK [Sporomusa ovata]